MKDIILIGAGSHANACIDIIEYNKSHKIKFLVDIRKEFKSNYKVIHEKEFNNQNLKRKKILITVGQIKLGNTRDKLFSYYKSKGCSFATIISKTSYVSKSAIIDKGTVVLHRSVISKNAKIGCNCIINTGAIIEHDVIIENNVHIAPGAVILGGAIIKKNSFIGSNTVIKQNKIIKENTIIPAQKYIK